MTDPDAPGLNAPERVYRELRRSILEGAFAPGERLTTISLSERLDVSRTPVRAALVRLEADGLIERADGRSARVRALTADEVEQAYDVAMGLEGMLAYRIAEAADPSALRDLDAAVAAMEAAAGTGDKQAWVEADERFHSLLAQHGHNPLLALMMERVETVIGRLRFLNLHVHPQSAERSAADHRAVVAAVQAGDPERARTLHHTHWDRVRSANIAFLREGFSGSAGYLFSTPSKRPAERKEASPTDRVSPTP